MSLNPATRLLGIEKSAIRKIYDRAPAGAINLGLGEPDLPTPATIRHEAIEFIELGKIHYSPNAGLLELRRAIAGYYGDATEFDRVCVTNGSQEALFATVMSLINPGDEVLLPDPGFLAYPTLVKMAGGHPVFYKLPANRDFKFDAQDFREKISPRTRAVIVNSPSNPTGCVLSSDDFQNMAQALAGTEAIVVADEIYRELYFGERPASIADYYPDTLIISGLSKSHAMTGWRLGWVYGDPEIVRHVTVFHQYATTCASTIAQHAALAAFTEAGYESLNKLRADLRERRDALVDLIETELAPILGSNVRHIIPEGAFYLMLDISRFGSSLEVAEKLLGAGVITIPGSAFGAESEGYLRLSFATSLETIGEGVRRMRKAFESGRLKEYE